MDQLPGIDFGEPPPDWESSAAAALSDRLTIRFLERERPADSLGEVLGRYDGIPHERLWMVEHLWYLIGCGDLTISSSPDEARQLLIERRCERIALRRARGAP
jgi:hypothetical protein